MENMSKDKILKSIIKTLETIIEKSNNNKIINIYTSHYVPNIKIGDYFLRIYRYTDCSIECYILGLVYIDRLLTKNPDIIFNNFTAHRILFSCTILAIKYLEDYYYSNSHYAKIGGLTLSEINKLEINTLKLLNFNAFVSFEEYQIYNLTLNKIIN